uniref:Uncharacterized protein n=1 Tax=Triticum urartu TaxID=4572 RepID=A0A8R7QDJ0_TRIUA
MTPPSPCPKCTASHLLRDFPSLSWHLPRLASGHQRLPGELPHSWRLQIHLPVVFPDFLMDLRTWPPSVEYKAMSLVNHIDDCPSRSLKS